MIHDPLNRFRIANALAGQRIGREIHIVEQTGSTNDDVTIFAKAGHPEGIVVFAESQSAGRGRRGNKWFAPNGSGLLFSILLRPDHPFPLWRRLTHVCALAICEAIEESTGIPTEIKWPNDIHINGKKIAGIIIESTAAGNGHDMGGFAIVGIGLNIHMIHDDFPPDLRSTATSLQIETTGERSLNRTSIAIALLRGLNHHYPDTLPNPRFQTSLDKIRDRSNLLGKMVTTIVSETKIQGLAHDFGPDGELVLRDLNGETHVISNADLVRVL